MYLLKELKRFYRVLMLTKEKKTRDKIETYAYGTSKEIACKKDEALYNNTIKQQNNSLV